MSQEGWQGFLKAEGVEDWVVLHGGATAVFKVKSLVEAAEFAKGITGVLVETLGDDPRGFLMTLANNQVTLRLTRDIWNLEDHHIQLARAISAVAKDFGAIAERRAVQEVQVAIASKPDMTHLAFWRAVLGYEVMAEDNAVDPLGHGSTVWMQEIDPEKKLRHAMHIDVSVAGEFAQARLDAALAAGGRIVDDTHAPGHWTLSDPAGNRVCICAWPDGK